MTGFLFAMKAKAWALGGLVLAVLATVARMKLLEHQRDKARARVQVAEAERDQVRSNVAIATTTRKERRVQRKKAVDQILAGEVPDALGADLNNFD